MGLQLNVPDSELAGLCRKWRVRELAVFGSALRADFGPSSDLDVLVTFETGAPWDAFDLIDFRQDLERMFGRPVDVIEKSALRNPFRRRSILETARVIYAA